MDELSRTPQEGPGTGTDRSEAQPALPFELPLEPLPFDDEADQPVDLALTARARRVVAPADVPALRLVTATPSTRSPNPGPDPAERDAAAARHPSAQRRPSAAPVEDDPSDTRPSRARALRRAGRTPSRIAQQLGVDELLVRAWVADVAPRRTRRRGGGETGEARTSIPPTTSSPAPQTPAQEAQAGGGSIEVVDDHRTAFELARVAARDEARRERLHDPDFAGGVGLLAGIAELDPHAVTITSVEPDVVVAALRWIREQLVVAPERVRVVLRIGPRVAGDLAAHRWAKVLEVPRERLAVASWRHAPTDDAEQVLLRIADPTAAAAIAGWRDALLAPPGDDPADVAF